jgi:hypothetical protein
MSAGEVKATAVRETAEVWARWRENRRIEVLGHALRRWNIQTTVDRIKREQTASGNPPQGEPGGTRRP